VEHKGNTMTRIIGNFLAAQPATQEKVESVEPQKKQKKVNIAYEEFTKIMNQIAEKNKKKEESGRIIACFRDKKIQEARDFVTKKKKGEILSVSIGDLIKQKQIEMEAR
jgi:Asp/Glu/hydantoin racemase